MIQDTENHEQFWEIQKNAWYNFSCWSVSKKSSNFQTYLYGILVKVPYIYLVTSGYCGDQYGSSDKLGTSWSIHSVYQKLTPVYFDYIIDLWGALCSDILPYCTHEVILDPCNFQISVSVLCDGDLSIETNTACIISEMTIQCILDINSVFKRSRLHLSCETTP